MLFSPLIIGGLQFTVLKGNGTDTFNYITMAGYLLHEPYSPAFHSSVQSLLDKNTSYPLAQILLTERWSTSMLLAWSSAITHVSLERIEYGFTLIFFLMTYGVAVHFARLLKLSFVYQTILAISICVGFWAQFTLDIRAFSQISALPIVLLFAYLFTDIESDESNNAWGKCLLLGMTFTSLVFLYIEEVPFVMLGAFIFITSQFLHKRYSMRRMEHYWLSLLVAIVALLPAAGFLLRFFHTQVMLALNSNNNWHHAYFYWLYQKPLTGVWGLSLARDMATNRTLNAFISLCSVSLTAYLVCSMYYILRLNKKANQIALMIAASLVLSGLLLFSCLFYRAQLWAAGKILSYSYPFIMFTLTAGVLEIKRYAQFPFSKVITLFGCCIVGIWLIFQCALGVYRIMNVINGKDYSGETFIFGHSEYKQHDWNGDAFIDAIKMNACSSLGIKAPSPWLTEYFNLVLGWKTHAVALDLSQNRAASIKNHLSYNNHVDCLLISKNHALIKDMNIIAENNEMALIKIRKNDRITLDKIISLVDLNKIIEQAVSKDNWLELNQKIKVPMAIIRKNPQIKLHIEGTIPANFLIDSLVLTATDNNHVIYRSPLLAGNFTLDIPLGMLIIQTIWTSLTSDY
jgi:hypothetical protein